MTDLALRSTVRELVAVASDAERVTRESFAALVAAEERMNAIFTMGDRHRAIRIDASRGRYCTDFRDIEKTVEMMRRQFWTAIVDRLEIRRALSIEREKALTKAIDEEDPLPVTEENVTALVRRFADDLPKLWEEAVREVFAWLRPRGDSWQMTKYKTNQKHARFELGERVVITGAMEGGLFGRPYVGSYTAPRLLALDNVFHGLDGNGTVAKTFHGPLVDAINASDGRGETDYFEFRTYKNRSLHIRFLRADLLKRFNAIAGGVALKPSNAA